jgi:hypothetical protein
VQRAVLGDLQPHRGQLPHLAAFVQYDRGLVQCGLALRTDRRPMLDHGIGHSHQVQRLAAMPQLSPRLLPAPLPQALGLPFEPVAGGRLGAIAAVLGQARAQLLDLGRQRRHLLAQQRELAHLLLQGGVLGFQFGDPGFGVWRHASTLHLLRKSA